MVLLDCSKVCPKASNIPFSLSLALDIVKRNRVLRGTSITVTANENEQG